MDDRTKEMSAAPPPGEEGGAPENGKKHKTLRALGALILKLVIIGALAAALLTFVLGVSVCHENAMFPAVRDGDLCITYRLRQPAYGDIVSYVAGGQRRYGRVVGRPGDVINIDPTGGYTVNGNIPYETIYYDTRADVSSNVTYPCTVREGELFLLNDMRDDMNDSRHYGPIPMSDTDGSLTLLVRRRSW